MKNCNGFYDYSDGKDQTALARRDAAFIAVCNAVRKTEILRHLRAPAAAGVLFFAGTDRRRIHRLAGAPGAERLTRNSRGKGREHAYADGWQNVPDFCHERTGRKGGGRVKGWRARWASVRAAWRRIPMVDRGLMLLMAVLLVQSAYVIFFPAADSGATAGNIDIVVRTSAAAIFGYFLSASFAAQKTAGVPTVSGGHIMEMADQGGDGTKARGTIGFVSETSVQSGSGAQTRGTAETATGGSRLQVVMATGIGLFCMVVLIVVRNSAQLTEAAAESSTMMATVVQFRDFVSACVGFLIGLSR